MRFFLPLLFVLFCALKFPGAIDWSWWWVFSPLFLYVAGWAFILWATKDIG